MDQYTERSLPLESERTLVLFSPNPRWPPFFSFSSITEQLSRSLNNYKNENEKQIILHKNNPVELQWIALKAELIK